MEENTAKMDEIQEIDTVEETNETPDVYRTIAMIAGFAGGIIAYGTIKVGGKIIKAGKKAVKNLWRKIRRKSDNVIEVEIIEDDPDAVFEQENTKK